MAMNPKCIEAVNKVAGRDLTPAQLRNIEDRLAVAQRRLARQDAQAWGAMSAEQRMLEGAKLAQQEIQGEAARKVANAQRQILATSATDGRIGDLGTNMKAGRTRALVEDINNTAHYIEGVKRENASQLIDLIEAASSGEGATGGRRVLQFLFDVDNPAMTRDLVGEIFGNGAGKTGNQIAKQGAQAWLKVIEGMRTRFNAAGGDVGKLEYGYLPQPHDAVRVGSAGADEWAGKTLPLLDRSQYLREDGTRMGDAEVLDFLKAAWETIRTDGMNKQAPGQFKGPGARANSGSESRQIHFKDGESYLAYNAEFGAGSMYDAMIGHVGAMARNIGMVERYGPNPNQQFNLQRDLAVRADGEKRVFGNGAQAYWDILTGTANAPQSARLAEIGQGIRNIQTFGKLAGAVLSSVTDLGTSVVTAGYNKLSYWDWLKNTATAGGKEAKDFMNTHGMIAESMLSDLNRWSGDHLQQGWTSRLANSTMKLSLMNAWTDTVRRGFSMTMMQGLGKLSAKPWADLTEWDRSHLGRKGITEADWAVVNRAQLTDFNGTPMLTPEAIAAADIDAARPADLQRVRDAIQRQTADLTARNQQDAQWIKGRIDKFDNARDALNRQVKAKHADRLAKNEKATGPMLERMALLDAQREAAQLQSDIETDFNRFATQDEVRTFLNAVEDGASADLTDVKAARREVRRGLEGAEAAGRRFGEAKGRLERRMQEIENRITAMDAEAGRATNVDAKAAAAKADEMRAELKEFVTKSQERQQRRLAVIQRLQAEEAPRLEAEAQRIRSEVTAKILGFITDESEYAVINPDMATKAVQTWGGQQTGTGAGELARLTMQFKSFPIAMISRHWRRMLEGDRGLDGAPALANKLAYGAALMLTTTALGAIAFQAKQVVQGKDPVDMTTSKFWSRAFAQGGGLGFMGDIILGDTTQDRSPLDSLGRMVLGPTFGSAADAWELTKGNIDEAMAGKDTHAGAEGLRFGQSHLPYINLWYAKAALNHAFLHAVQENLSPGYLSRQRKRAAKDWDQDYWWEPGEAVPERAPDLSAIGGN